ncbi:MAG TPA: hypothetical protein VEF36_07500, partial [Roseiarcus sp.]|nr:hypothetical protein [Roseiarcus sp.]
MASDDLSRRTERQGANLEETAAALSQISATVETSAKGANRARQVVAAADDGAKKGALAEVSVAITRMDQTTQRNAAMAEQATAAGRAVSQETKRLTELVG